MRLQWIFFALIILFFCQSCNKENLNNSDDIDDKIVLTITKNIPVIKDSKIVTQENLNFLFKISSSNNESIGFEIFNVIIEETESNIIVDLEIKEEYAAEYTISTGGTIFSEIFDLCEIFEELEQIGENESDYIAMLNIICDNTNFDFENSESVIIPITFHLLSESLLANMNPPSLEQLLVEKLTIVNGYFSNTKLGFELKGINIFDVEHFPGYNILNQTRADEANIPYDETSLNIYVADYIGPSIECISKRSGVAQFPDSNFRTNRIFIESIGFKDSTDPNTFLITHELGHTFSLFHNFQNSPFGGFLDCPENPCLENDDTVCDTLPADMVLSQSLDCDDNRVKNIMSYSVNSHPQCNGFEFTNEQNKRIRFAAEYWYSNLFVNNNELPQVTTNDVTNISSVSATSGGNVITGNGYNVTSRGVCWSTNQNPTLADDYSLDGSGLGKFESQITNLQDNTQYYVRAYATNAYGTSYGLQKAFTTKGSGGNIFEGDVSLLSQQEIDDFAAQNYSIITGNLLIGAADGVDLNLASLSSLTEVQGELAFGCKDCSSLQGLNNINRVGYLTLRRFNNLSDFEGLNGLTNVLENVVIGGVFFNKNLNLYSLDGLDNLTYVGGYIYVRGNDQLQNIDAFSGLQNVDGDYLRIRGNINLNNLCGLTNIVLLEGIAGDYSVYENAYNPTEQDIINGNCSQ